MDLATWRLGTKTYDPVKWAHKRADLKVPTWGEQRISGSGTRGMNEVIDQKLN